MIDDHSLLNEVRCEFMVLEGLLRTPSALRAQGQSCHRKEKLNFKNATKIIATKGFYCGDMD